MKVSGNWKGNRLGELDFLRGIAIISMVIIHIVYDLMYFHIIEGFIGSEPWSTAAFFTVSLFLLLVGISFSISYSRRSGIKGTFWKIYPHYLKRGLFILLCGMAITIATINLLPSGFIVFGILQMIGTSIIIAPFFAGFGKNNFFLGIAAIIAGIIVMNFSGPYFLLPIGIHPQDFFSYDYEPLLPWFGIVLIGMQMGNVFYPNGRRIIQIEEMRNPASKFLSFLGRNSLLIYMIHQPIILGIIYFLLR